MRNTGMWHATGALSAHARRHRSAAHARQASLTEVRELIERERLFGLGCGLVNWTLLVSTMLTAGAQLWTLDQGLRLLAERFEIAYLRTRHQTC